jgi:polyphosphate:AMP phosphotransferase
LQQQLSRINQFEQQQADDGVLIIKCWLHLSKSVQKQRIKKLEKDPETTWKVTSRDKKHLKYYDQFIKVAETIIKETSSSAAPWLTVEGTDLRYSSLTIGEHILDKITGHIEHRTPAKQQADTSNSHDTITLNHNSLLGALDLSHTLAEQDYQQQLSFFQSKIFRLTRKARKQKLSTILVFEGWDAAGKGGALRRLAHAIDARNYHIIPIAAPTDEERQHHYLWRFWRHLPHAGKVTIFDRSWYGRVLVERVENLASELAWQRAYAEIVNFEELLIEHGILLMKYWLHIDKDEQLRRFQQREQISYKKHKITEDDYRNRKQWDAYEMAVNDMVARTSTQASPWLLVEANDKKFARSKVLKAYCERLEQLLSS